MRSMLTDEEDNGTPRHGAFVPLLLLALAVVGWLAFQTMQLLREREQLTHRIEPAASGAERGQAARVARRRRHRDREAGGRRQCERPRDRRRAAAPGRDDQSERRRQTALSAVR